MHTAAIYISPNIATDITDAHKNTNTNLQFQLLRKMQERKENEHTTFFTTLNVNVIYLCYFKITENTNTQDRSFKSNPQNQISIVINRND